MNKRRYPIGLFIIGFISNVLFRYFWLFLPCIVLLITGFFVAPCKYIGLILLGIDVILSLIEQIKIRNAFLADSDHPDFQRFQEALSRDGNWMENMQQFVQDKTDHNNE